MSGDEPERDSKARGRTFGMSLFGIVVGGITLIFSVQILRQTFAPVAPSTELTCPELVTNLWAALSRARQSAAGEPSELASVSAFRRGLVPEWELAPHLDRLCAGEPRQLRTATALLRLRYAEESAARFGSRELSSARNQVADLVNELSQRPNAGIGGDHQVSETGR